MLAWWNMPFGSSYTTASVVDDSTIPKALTPATIAAATTSRAKANGGFIFADSDQRLLTDNDLRNFSKDDLRVARNEIYARRGRFFVDVKLAGYFAQFSWYRPRFVEVELSALETTNVDTDSTSGTWPMKSAGMLAMLLAGLPFAASAEFGA